VRAADVVAPLEAAAAPPLHEATAHAASDVKSAVVRAAVGVYATPAPAPRAEPAQPQGAGEGNTMRVQQRNQQQQQQQQQQQTRAQAVQVLQTTTTQEEVLQPSRSPRRTEPALLGRPGGGADTVAVPAAAAPQPGRQARSAGRQHVRTSPLCLQPCGRGEGMHIATAVSDRLANGGAVLLSAGSSMQLVRGVAALATARTLLLSSDGARGLAFQPQWGRGEAGATLLVHSVPEAQLRRVERMPLVASAYGAPKRLGAAVIARVRQQGYTAVRGTGAAAASAAVAAVAHARRALLAAGLDLVVVPATEFVEATALPPPSNGRASGSSGARAAHMDDDTPRLVRVTVLHITRCTAAQPWQLQPWAPQPGERQRRASQGDGVLLEAAGEQQAAPQAAAADLGQHQQHGALQALPSPQPSRQQDFLLPKANCEAPQPGLLAVDAQQPVVQPALGMQLPAQQLKQEWAEHLRWKHQDQDQQTHLEDGSHWCSPASGGDAAAVEWEEWDGLMVSSGNSGRRQAMSTPARLSLPRRASARQLVAAAQAAGGSGGGAGGGT
jgi:stage V sporulation protein SpoVS